MGKRKRSTHYRVKEIASRQQVSVKDAERTFNDVLTTRASKLDRSLQEFELELINSINQFKLNKNHG